MSSQADLLKRSDFNNEKITTLTDLYLELDKIKQKTSGSLYSSYNTHGFKIEDVEKLVNNSKISEKTKKRIINYLNNCYNTTLNRTISLMKFAIQNRKSNVNHSMFASKLHSPFISKKKYIQNIVWDDPIPTKTFIVDTTTLPTSDDAVKNIVDSYKQPVNIRNKQCDYLKQSDFSGYTVYGLTNLMSAIEANKLFLQESNRPKIYDFFSSNRLFCIDHVLKEKIVEYLCAPHGFGFPINRTVSLIHKQIVKLVNDGKELLKKHEEHVKNEREKLPLKQSDLKNYTISQLQRIRINFENDQKHINNMSRTDFKNYCIDNISLDAVTNRIDEYLYSSHISGSIVDKLNNTISLIKEQISKLEEFNKPTRTESQVKDLVNKYKTAVNFDSKTGVMGVKMSRKTNKWNPNDITALKKLYPFNTVKELMPLLNRSYDSIAYMIKKEKISK